VLGTGTTWSTRTAQEDESPVETEGAAAASDERSEATPESPPPHRTAGRPARVEQARPALRAYPTDPRPLGRDFGSHSRSQSELRQTHRRRNHSLDDKGRA
jgi:hypothetical protein